MRIAAAILTLVITTTLAAESRHTVSLFGSGIARRTRENVPSWEGGVGVAWERAMQRWSFEAAIEQRRDIVLVTAGGRLCGPVRNTCFSTHRMRVTSTPLVVLARYRLKDGRSVTPFGSAGFRFVPDPSVRDLSPETLVPRSYFSLPATRRSSAEAGLGIDWRLSERVLFFLETRSQLSAGAEWDPQHRWNAGLRIAGYRR